MGERFSKYAGGGVHPTTEVKLNEPIKITFVHEMAPQSKFYHPTCAYWSISSHRWDTVGCKLLNTNRSAGLWSFKLFDFLELSNKYF